GAVLISQAAISSGVATTPRWGLSANAELQTNASAEAARARRLRIDMLHLADVANAPARDAIEMINRFAAAIGDEGGARWLDIAGIVRRAALQDRRSAIPMPRHLEARQRHSQQRLLQHGRRPALAAVGRDFD